jgi:(p)ppGpp synthase/HD superfamily hydrolase
MKGEKERAAMVSSKGWFQAITFAARAHEGEKRKGENPPPYICHPFFVGLELLRVGCGEDTVIAGILHDTLEDGFPGLPREDGGTRSGRYGA